MTKKFQFTDIDGRLKEAVAYAAEDFVSVAAPNAPVVTGPSGQLDPSLIPPLPAGQAVSVAITRKASEPILRGDAVRASTLGYVGLATRNTDLGSATVLGIALNDAVEEENVTVLILGVLTDPLFSSFSVNEPLFLDLDGGITNTRPTTKFLTYLGKHLGGNDILVNVSSPISLGVV